MPKYLYQAKYMTGQPVQGEIEAGNEAEARVILRSKKLIPLRVVPKAAAAPKQAKGLFQPKVKAKDLQIFTRQFATLINSGIPVVQSIEILAQSSRVGFFSTSLKAVAKSVAEGKRLGDALSEFPTIFDKLYVNMVKAGEEGGVLDTVLGRLAVYIEKSVGIKRKVVGALYYPIIIMIVAVAVVVGILVFVIPKFKDLFGKAGKELPALTQWVINLSEGFQHHWLIIFGTTFGLGFVGFQYYSTEAGKQAFDQIVIDLPLFGPLVQKSAIARFSRTLSTLLSSGVGILEALEISGRTVGNYVVERAILKSKNSISEGKSITVPLAKEKYMPDMVVQMIGVGEQTGNLDSMLGKIADFYEDEVDVAVSALTSMIEPMLMVFLGGIVGVLVISMYLPVFSLAGAIQ